MADALFAVFSNMLDNSRNSRLFPLIAAGSIIFLLLLSVKRPYLFSEKSVLAALVLVVAGLIASQFRTHFWKILIGVFFWAGSSFPLSGEMNMFRWVVLGLGAFLALAYYARMANRIAFNHLHLLGLFTVITAFASAMVSVNPMITVLKSLSLAALFVYASIGARVLWSANPEPFVRSLVLMAEGLVYLSALCALASFEVWGNPNSLGLIMGCLCWPVLLWRLILPVNRHRTTRSVIPLLLCGALLVFSLSRASILAALLISMFLLVGARRYRTLLFGMSLFATIVLNLFLVTPGRFQAASDALLYKTGEHGNFMDSRQKPWKEAYAISAIIPGWGSDLVSPIIAPTHNSSTSPEAILLGNGAAATSLCWRPPELSVHSFSRCCFSPLSVRSIKYSGGCDIPEE